MPSAVRGKCNRQKEALVQVDGYLDQLGLDRGTLIILGRSEMLTA